MSCQTPHGDKLRSLLENDKLPSNDQTRVQAAIERYEAWITELDGMSDVGKSAIGPMVSSLNRYKT